MFPPGVVTTMSTAGPAVPAGVLHSMLLSLLSTGSVHARPPMVTVASSVRLSPEMTTVSPPAARPVCGVTVMLAGGSR
jgi:hypothetical protein